MSKIRFREKIGRKTSKPVLQLVDGVRTPKGVRQRIVISLANLQIYEDMRKSVANRIGKLLHGQHNFVDIKTEVERLANHVVQIIRIQGRWQHARNIVKVPPEADQGTAEVYIDAITHTDSSELGPVLVGLNAWEQLSLSKIFKKEGFTPKQIHTAMVFVIKRLVDPGAEHRLSAWVRYTALPDLLKDEPLSASKDRFYRISDKLLKCQESISKGLTARETNLFNLKRTLILYDLTNPIYRGTAGK